VSGAQQCSPRFFQREVRRLLRRVADGLAQSDDACLRALLWFCENPPPRTTGRLVSVPRSLRHWLGRWVLV
jgi:hypothetical protein